eukprot:5566942-Pyramimonas_sp.AAC.1
MAEIKRARMMLAAVAPPTPFETPVKWRGVTEGPFPGRQALRSRRTRNEIVVDKQPWDGEFPGALFERKDVSGGRACARAHRRLCQRERAAQWPD